MDMARRVERGVCLPVIELLALVSALHVDSQVQGIYRPRPCRASARFQIPGYTRRQWHPLNPSSTLVRVSDAAAIGTSVVRNGLPAESALAARERARATVCK